MYEQVEPHIVDAAILGGLRVYAKSEAFLQQVVEIFEQHGQSSMDELHAAIGSDDLDAVRRVAHRLKGSCLNVGASLMVYKLRNLEQLATKNAPLPEVYAAVDNLTAVFSETCKALKSML